MPGPMAATKFAGSDPNSLVILSATLPAILADAKPGTGLLALGPPPSGVDRRHRPRDGVVKQDRNAIRRPDGNEDSGLAGDQGIAFADGIPGRSGDVAKIAVHLLQPGGGWRPV